MDLFTKHGQSMIKIQFRKKYYQKWSLKNPGLKVQVSNLKRHEDVCTIIISSFESNMWKGLGQRGWMDNGV